MKISFYFKRLKFRPAIVAGVLAVLAGAAFAQGTTSEIRVNVMDERGDPVANVQVSVTHVPTGRTQILSSNNAGIVNARGLAVGGPYEVAIVGGNQYSADVMQDIYTELDRTAVVDISVRPVMEEVLVTAEAPTGEVAVGVGRDFDRARIDATPSVSRDFVNTLATDPKILVDNSVARGPAVSIAGQNFRFNNLTIDGVAQNDNFGLSKNASSTQRTPISIDAIEALTVNVAPYDVTYGSFIGGNINVVTKSGTNDFEGSVFYFTTDDSLTGDKSEGQKLGIGDFDEEVYGFTLGGPIVRDKLFFFANYEKFETTRPSNSQTIDNIVGVTQADVDRVINIFQTEYGFDPGTFDATDVDEDEKILIKLDWNINDDHRAVASYQRADGDVLFDDFPDLAVLQSNRYDINETLDAYSLQVFSNWTDKLSTEFKYGVKDVANRQVSIDSSTPDFAITAPGGGTITAGGDRFRHNNKLDNESDQLRIKADYVAGDHVITAGFERQAKKTINTFVPFTRGQFLFFSIDDLEARNIGLVLFGGSTSGVVADAVGIFELVTNSFYIQDEWAASDELILKFGLRYDEHSNDDEVPLNPNFAARNPFDNTFNLDGNDLLMPRFGFDWSASDRLTIRGGAGLFGGGEPLIMLSNSYQGNGITRNIVCIPCIGAAFGVLGELAAALPDPNIAFDLLQPSNGVNPDSDVETINPNFETLSTWKYSIGAEYVADFSAIGLGDGWNLRADLILSDVKDGFNVREGRRTVTGTAPDGRNIYSFTPGGDYILENTNKGESTVFSFDLAKSWDSRAGMFDVTLGYTHTDAKEIRSYNRFVTFESYAFDATPDFNNMPLSTSKYEVPHRITGTFDWSKQLFGDNTTRASLVYFGRSGRNYSYTFASNPTGADQFGGTFLADFGSEGDNPGSHLFYVPTGTSDPLVTGDPTFLANLNAFIDSESCLRGKRGEIVKRNSCRTDFTSIVSLRLLQEIGIGRDKTLELILDIENLGNLLNDDWGRVDSYPAPSNVALTLPSISADGSQYIYAPVSSDQVSADTIAPRPAIARLPSVYRIQFGARFRF